MASPGLGTWKRRLVSLHAIQGDGLFLALDNAGKVWELTLLQGSCAVLKPVSLWSSPMEGGARWPPNETP